MSWPNQPITKEAAVSALTASAWTDDNGRTTVHSFRGPMGADHDLDQALDRVEKAIEVMWTAHWCRHDLAVITDIGVTHYDVPRPERSQVGAS